MAAGNAKLANEILNSIATDAGDGFGNEHAHAAADSWPRVATINVYGRPATAPEVEVLADAQNLRD